MQASTSPWAELILVALLLLPWGRVCLQPDIPSLFFPCRCSPMPSEAAMLC